MGATEEREITFDPDGGSFLTSAGTRQSTLWIHDASGERRSLLKGTPSFPRFSPDGNRLYYLQRSGADRRYVSGELWSANLETGKRERLLPEFLLADYSVSRDGNRILFVAIADDGATSVWMAPLDGRAAPYRLSNVTAERAFFGAMVRCSFLGRTRQTEDSCTVSTKTGAVSKKPFRIRSSTLTMCPLMAVGGRLAGIRGPGSVDPWTSCHYGECGVRIYWRRECGTTPPCVSWSPNGRFLFPERSSRGPDIRSSNSTWPEHSGAARCGHRFGQAGRCLAGRPGNTRRFRVRRC